MSNLKTAGRPKGYAKWRLHKKTRVTLEQVDQVLVGYQEHLPLTIRQVFYRLVGLHDYPKTEADYKRLCEYLVRARRAGMIPFDSLRDDGLSVMGHRHYDGAEDFHRQIRLMGERFKQDKLANQDVDIRVYCEAEGMMPQLGRILEPYSVPVRSCSGFDSLSAKRDLLEWALATEVYEGKTPVVLHLGDCDPSGSSIFESVRDDVLAFMDSDDPDLARKVRNRESFRRVALTAEQIGLYRLPTAPPKGSDSRSANWEGDTCQLEALEPEDLKAIVEIEVEEWLDSEQLRRDREQEITTRRELMRALPAGGAA